MPISGIAVYAHVRLTVTDIDRSRDFYDNVFGFDFGFDIAVEMPADADENTQQALWFLFGGVIYYFPGGLLGLRPAAQSDDAFHPHRVGLDHLSFTVANVDALHAAATVLDDLGVTHHGVQIDSGFRLLEFTAPTALPLNSAAKPDHTVSSWRARPEAPRSGSDIHHCPRPGHRRIFALLMASLGQWVGCWGGLCLRGVADRW